MQKLQLFYKKILIGVLGSTMILSNIQSQVFAAPRSVTQAASESNASCLNAIQVRCMELDNYIQNSSTGQYGLLFELQILTAYAMYTQALLTADDYGLTNSEKTYYLKHLSELYKNFNIRYAKKSKSYVALKLENDFKTTESFLNSISFNIVVKAPAYVKTMLKGVKKELDAVTNSTEKERIMENNTVLLSNVEKLYAVLLNVPDEVGNLTPILTDGTHQRISFEATNKGKIVTLETAVNKAAVGMQDLLEIGEEHNNITKNSEKLTLDLSKNYVENLSDAVMTGGIVQVPEDPKLSLAYLAILAASATYTPLQSFAGDSTFTTALQSVAEDELTGQQLVDIYNKTKDLRKPLYKRNLDEKGKPTGVATLITIEDFFNQIRDGSVGSLCTVKGEFRFNTETQAWLYYQDNLRNTGEQIINSNVGEDAILAENAGNALAPSITPEVTSSPQASVIPTTSKEPSSTKKPANQTPVKKKNNVLKFFRNTGKSISDNGKKISDFVSNGIKDLGDAIEGWFSSNATGTLIVNAQSVDDNSTLPTTSPVPTTSPANPTVAPSASPINPITDQTNNNNQGKEANSAKESDSRIEDNAVYAYEEIADESKLTDSLFLYGSKYARSVDNMTTLLMNNILANTSNLNQIRDSKSRYLYVNVYGDITTDDNLIVLPGFCNPLMYESTARFNPFSVGFMNAYPTVLRNTSYFQLSSKRDIGKYIILAETTENSGEIERLVGAQLNSINSVKTFAPIVLPELESIFTVNGNDNYNLLAATRLIFGAEGAWEAGSFMFNYNPLVVAQSASVNGKVIFPYVASDDSNFDAAKAIAQNAYFYLAHDPKSKEELNVGNTCDNYILHNFIISGLNGTNNPIAYSKNQIMQYENYLKNGSSRRLQVIKELSTDILDKTSDVTGVIGLRSAYKDPILGKVFQLVRENWIMFFFLLLLILLFSFAKMRQDLFQILILLASSSLVAYLFVMIIPVYLPMFFNMVINNVTENLTYEILGTKTEFFDANNVSDVAVDADGKLRFNTTSLTLYKVSVRDLKKFTENLNEEETALTAGKSILLNPESGLFAEGDSLKVNTDLLFSTLKIRGDMENKEGEFVYQLKTEKTVSSNLDYYMPFYQIVDAFIDKLNKASAVYEIPRKTTTFIGNVNKDNYLVYSYVNSKPFITPGEYSTILPADLSGWSEENIKDYEEEGIQLQQDLEAAFGHNIDFLGVASFLYKPSAAMRKTLWAQTMQRNGYYTKDWSVNEEKMNDLVTYINYQTKKFIYKMGDQIGNLSDDVMIKMISLRALIALTQKASEFGHWLYPFSLNYEELSLNDVLRCVFVDNYGKFVSMDMDIIDYMGDRHGWFNLIMFDVLAVLLFVLVNVVPVLVSVSYLLLGILILYRIIISEEIKTPVKGFFKSMLITMTCFTSISLGIVIARSMGGNVFAIYFLLLVSLLNLFVIGVVIGAILTNITDLGNNSINAKFSSMLNFLPSFHKDDMQVNTTNVSYTHAKGTMYPHDSHNRRNNRLYRYQDTADVDEFYFDNFKNGFKNERTINGNQTEDGVDKTDSSDRYQDDLREAIADPILDLRNSAENEINDLR